MIIRFSSAVVEAGLLFIGPSNRAILRKDHSRAQNRSDQEVFSQ